VAFVYLVDGLLHHLYRVGFNQSRDFFPDFGKIPRLLAWRLSRFRICFPLGFLDTHSRSKMPSKKFGRAHGRAPKTFSQLLNSA